ncbi:hypothetical protein HK104_003490 [Borealophlyctis nickersoniae]|nr:hypothetical protein HK104_003490 [Borealophlyctis nickersoniae]
MKRELTGDSLPKKVTKPFKTTQPAAEDKQENEEEWDARNVIEDWTKEGSWENLTIESVEKRSDGLYVTITWYTDNQGKHNWVHPVSVIHEKAPYLLVAFYESILHRSKTKVFPANKTK